MQAPQSYSPVTSLAAALLMVAAPLPSMQAGTAYGLLVASMVRLVDRPTGFTSLSRVYMQAPMDQHRVPGGKTVKP